MFSQASRHLGAQGKAETRSLPLPLQEAEQGLLEGASSEKVTIAPTALHVAEIHSSWPEVADIGWVQCNLLRAPLRRAPRARPAGSASAPA